MSTDRRRRCLLVLCALAGLAGSVAAQSPAGWKLIVRIVPNPLPAGRCAMISVEVQDDEGYRRTELSDGRVIDFHTFRYVADTTAFKWQNGNPVNGYICATSQANALSRTTVTVTLPDGLSGSVALSALAPGQSAPAVQYAPQGRLRLGRGAPGTAKATTPSQAVASGKATDMAPTTGARAMNPLSSSGGITTARLQVVGSYFTLQPMALTTPSLTMTGSDPGIPPREVTTTALAMTGVLVSTTPQDVTTAVLSMVGSAFAPQTIATPALVMTGSAASPARVAPSSAARPNTPPNRERMR